MGNAHVIREDLDKLIDQLIDLNNKARAEAEAIYQDPSRNEEHKWPFINLAMETSACIDRLYGVDTMLVWAVEREAETNISN